MPCFKLRPVIVIEAEDAWHAKRLFDLMAIEENEHVRELVCAGVEDVECPN